ncbi:MAG: transcription termination factor NusA [Candidatus Omnitrophota bacterium]
MNGELLNVLDSIERDKGIQREVLIEAVESALVSAARKVIVEKDDITVKLDNETGEIRVFSGEEEVKSAQFGRIAAQTAKQVIIQKIREAERNVIFDDYTTRKGSLVTGMAHRFEKGNIIVDLGRAEAVLPKSELLKRERYNQGDRVKAYILDVEKTAKGPRILLSRKCEGMVKRLFEQEIPEIADGIVEIKAVARDAGERTKIAVSSKDDKVDSVGACVGMRGQRVKNIVRELHGEKIDIVRYNDDTREFIKGALSPAEISEIKLDSNKKVADIIVADDQLSLAIGRKGQNVRLASELLGYEINIKGKTNKVEELSEEEVEEDDVEAGEITLSLSLLPGVGQKTLEALEAAGFNDIKSVASSNVEAISNVQGIGKKTAEKIVSAAQELEGV